MPEPGTRSMESSLLRICTAGSVDDGKSTLIGRLLHDSQSVYEDQVASVAKIIEELVATRHSERQLRVIDHDQDGSMELKKREGYF